MQPSGGIASGSAAAGGGGGAPASATSRVETQPAISISTTANKKPLTSQPPPSGSMSLFRKSLTTQAPQKSAGSVAKGRGGASRLKKEPERKKAPRAVRPQQQQGQGQNGNEQKNKKTSAKKKAGMTLPPPGAVFIDVPQEGIDDDDPFEDDEDGDDDGLDDDSPFDGQQQAPGQDDTETEVVDDPQEDDIGAAPRSRREREREELQSTKQVLRSLRTSIHLSISAVVTSAILACWSLFEMQNNISLLLMLLVVAMALAFYSAQIIFYYDSFTRILKTNNNPNSAVILQLYSKRFTNVVMLGCFMLLVLLINAALGILSVVWGLQVNGAPCANGIFGAFKYLTDDGKAIFILEFLNVFYTMGCFFWTIKKAHRMNMYYVERTFEHKFAVMAVSAMQSDNRIVPAMV